MTSVFVAGSRKVGRLNDQIRERLHNLVAQNYRIIIGDANGADKAVQRFLHDHAYRDVVVYCSGKTCRNNVGGWTSFNVHVAPNCTGRDFYTQKDKKMAEDADYGFMIWDGKSPGTLNNILELLKRNKKSLVFFCPDRRFVSIATVNQVKDLLQQCAPEDISSIASKVNLNMPMNQSHATIQATFDF